MWREMIGIERKAQAANIGITGLFGRDGRDSDPNKVRRQGDEVHAQVTELKTPIGKYTCPSWLLSSQFYMGIIIIAIFIVLLVVPIMDKPEQQNCLAMVIFVSLLWATEVRTDQLKYDHSLTVADNSSLCNLTSRTLLGGHLTSSSQR